MRGNHEDYILHCGESAPDSELDGAMRSFADWTARQLGARADRLRNWPDHLCLHGPAGDWIHLTHGSLVGNRDGISPSVPDSELPGRVPDDVALFVTFACTEARAVNRLRVELWQDVDSARAVVSWTAGPQGSRQYPTAYYEVEILSASAHDCTL